MEKAIKKVRPASGRRWAVTVFEGSGTELDKVLENAWKSKKFAFVIGQKEVCPETKRVHVQAYVRCNNPMRMESVKRAFGDGVEPHCEMAWAKEAQNIAYVTKEEGRLAGPWEFGERSRQGRRVDLEGLWKKAKEGVRFENAIDQYSFAGQYMKCYDRLALTHRPGEVWQETILVYGEPGCGKTKFVRDNTLGQGRPLYQPMLGCGHKWYDGYYGQEDVLLDDFDGARDHMRLYVALVLLDRYEVMVQVKGGCVWFNPKRKWVTTMTNPLLWWRFDDRESAKYALIRRFNWVVRFVPIVDEKGEKTYTILKYRGTSLRDFWKEMDEELEKKKKDDELRLLGVYGGV